MVSDKKRKDGYIEQREEYVLKQLSDGTKVTVRELQLEVLSIMDEIHRICEKNGIEYFLIAGSALGICNYGGFIPWDDDMDIAVPRKDWIKFVEALKSDLSDDFYFDCYEIDSKYNPISGPMMKVRKRGTYIEEVNFLLKNRCKRGDGVFVDVIIYDTVSENKWVDQFNRTVIKLVMPFIVLLDNLHINPVFLKKFVRWFSNRYSRKNENSKLVSQPISVPWEKFLKEPIFLKKDVYPLKKYNFEGRKFYSYHNIERVLKQWYGPNCLKKWNGSGWEETFPIEKRKPKHVKDINLHGEGPVCKR